MQAGWKIVMDRGLAVASDHRFHDGVRAYYRRILGDFSSVGSFWPLPPYPRRRLFAEPSHAGSLARKFMPADRAIVSQVPDSRLAINQQVEDGMDQVGHIGRRDYRAVARNDLFPALELFNDAGQEIIVVPRAEEGAGADD